MYSRLSKKYFRATGDLNIMYKFGISMRVTNSNDYNESRDSISIDWSNYMISSFPSSQFLFIPNIQKNVRDYIQSYEINTIILTGGDDLNSQSRRDKTELILIEYALQNKIPIIAVCRGLQLVHKYFGGLLVKGDKKFIQEHKVKKHTVYLDDGSSRKVNSYHSNYIKEQTISSKFEIFARCKTDNTVEGLKSERILAMMWHPEREKKIEDWNKELILRFLKNE